MAETETHPGTPIVQGSTEPPSTTVLPERPTIPLVCHLCPKSKKSNFSDTSHLLTHIGSKSHLHNKFNLELRMDTDRTARKVLDKYNKWFEGNDIKSLLLNRQESRAHRLKSRRNSKILKLNKSGPDADQDSDAALKFEPEDDIQQYVNFSSNLPFQVPNWQDHDSFPSDLDAAHGYQNGEYNTPPMLHPHFPFAYANSMLPRDLDEETESKYEASEEGFDEEHDIDDVDDYLLPSENTELLEDETGASTLKGIVYPGMGKFDSATDEAKRKRNQKKDPSVLIGMRRLSEAVTREEQVLSVDLEYERSRDVYDDASVDENMLYEEEKKPTSRRRKRATTVAHKPTRGRKSRARKGETTERRNMRNIAANNTSRRSTRTSSRASQLAKQQQEPHSPPSTSMSNRRLGMLSHSHSAHDELEIFRDPVASSTPKPNEGRTERTLFRRHNDRLPGLALRPGNPNLSVTSSSLSAKKSQSNSCSGKENGPSYNPQLSVANPYLTSNDTLDNGDYNPLCLQPRDSLGFRLFPTWENDYKPSPVVFQSLPGHREFASLTDATLDRGKFSSRHVEDYEP